MNRDPGRGQTFGREYGQRQPRRSDQGFGGQGGEDLAGRNMGGEDWVFQGGQPPGGWREERYDTRRAGRFGRDLGRRAMTEGQADFGSTQQGSGGRGGESMFGPGGLGGGGFGASSFGLGGRYVEEPSFRGESQRGRGPKGHVRSDERIREDVCEALTEDERLDASEIEVEVRGGEVTLDGLVHSRDDKRRADDLAEDVGGVRHVQNNLRVERHDWAGYSTSPGR